MGAVVKLSVRDEEALGRVKALLEENLEEPPSLDQLCRKSGLNAEKLKKGFKQLYGLPPYAFHVQFKMEAAKKLLADTEQSVNEIAWSLGYEHASNFCEQFKKATGKRPGGWRKAKIRI
jgi:AraC family transcriptional activator of pyochelin receptor